MPDVEPITPRIRQSVVRIPSGESRLHGVWYASLSPEGEEERLYGVAVAFFPLGEERKGCVRVVHELAMEMAAEGWGVLSFDYAGTGESPGGFEQVTWPSLLADADAGLRFAMGMFDQHGRRKSDNNPTVFLGIRLGARIAIEAAMGSRHEIDGYCFWEPVFAGKEWLEELRRRSKFRGTGGSGQGQGEATVSDIDGYPFSAELCRNLEGLNPANVSIGNTPCKLIQISHRNLPSDGMQAVTEQLNCAEEIECLRMQPFWLESDLADYRAIINPTNSWFTSLV
ncbi:MAG: alpha/beta hydrolase [Planctomycetes bacterium]|nr:alpha/beta hydrolase [Planctomycetota bacterium]